MAGGTITLSTNTQRALINITDEINKICHKQQISSGIIYLVNPHTTAGLTINEGADPNVCKDIIAGLEKIVPRLNYQHMEGNSPAHIMTLLTGSSLTVHVDQGKLLLGTWQQIFFCEFDGPRNRQIRWRYIADQP